MTLAIRDTDQFIDADGAPIVNGYMYIGVHGLDPKLNPLAIFTDETYGTPLANPVRTDSLGRPTQDIFFIGSLYSYMLEDSSNVIVESARNRTASTTTVLPYASDKDFQVDDIVSYDGLLWSSLQTPNIGNTPSGGSAYWDIPIDKTMFDDIEAEKLGQLNVVKITLTGDYTPSPNLICAAVELTGGGGSGGGVTGAGGGTSAAGAGGGAGGYARKMFLSSEIPSSVPVTIGEGGIGVDGLVGGAGGSSSFGVSVTASGGAGGGASDGSVSPVISLGGDGGTATGGDIVSDGGIGQPGLSVAPSSSGCKSGDGGASFWGGGASSVSGTTAGSPAVTVGSGGSGASNVASNADRSGGDGFRGECIITEYLS